MSFTDRRWRGFEGIPRQRINSGDWCTSDRETTLISNVVANHAQALQVNGGGIGYGPDSGETWGVTYELTPGRVGDVVTLPLSEIVTGVGSIRVNLYLEMDTATDYAYLIAGAGRSVDKVYFENTTSLQWVTATVQIDTITHPMLINDLVLGIRIGVDYEYGTGTANTVVVRSISVYETPGLDLGAPHQDTSGATNRLASDSYPYSAAASRLIANNTNVIRKQRVPRGQIMQQVIRDSNGAASVSYPANNDNGGRWIVSIGSGVLALDGVMAIRATGLTATGKIGIYSLNSIGYTSKSQPFTVGMLLIGSSSGAMARITDVTDAGSTGTLGLGRVTGEFSHAEPITGYDPYGATSGSATANTAVSGPVIIDDDEITFTYGSDYYKNLSLSLPGSNRQQAEYEIRLAYKHTISVNLTELLVREILETPGAYEQPNPLHCESHDDVLASVYRKAKKTNEYLFGNSHRTLINQYYKQSREPYSKTHYTSNEFDDDQYSFYREMSGTLNAVGNKLVASIWYSRPLKTFKRIDLTGSSGVISVGSVITGATTKAEATVTMKRGSPATSISIDNIKGSFGSSEPISFSSGGTATTSGSMYDYQATQTLRFGVFRPDEWLVYKDIDLSQAERNIDSRLDIELALPESILKDISIAASGISSSGDRPISFVIQTISDDASDFIVTNKCIVFERVSAPGQWKMSQEDNDN